MTEKWIFVLGLFYICMVGLPFLLLLVAGSSLTNKVEPSLIGGGITASGIFAVVITSSIISRREALRKYHYLMAIMNLGLLLYAIDLIFAKQLILGSTLTLLDFALVLMSLNANAFLAIIIAWRLLWQKPSD